MALSVLVRMGNFIGYWEVSNYWGKQLGFLGIGSHPFLVVYCLPQNCHLAYADEL